MPQTVSIGISTSRQRILSAIAHKEPDRVPIDLGSMRSTGIMAIAYNRLKAHIGMQDSPTYLYDIVQQLAEPDQWALDRFHVDAVDFGRAFRHRQEWCPWTLPDGSPVLTPAWFHPERLSEGQVVRDSEGTVIARMPVGALYFDQACWPLSCPDSLENFEPLAEKMKKVNWSGVPVPPYDHPLTDERLDEIARVARDLYENTDYAISLGVGCNLFEWMQFLFGMENAYLHMAGEKVKLGRFLDRLTELHIETLERLLPRVRGYVQVLVLGDDLGMQNGPQMSRKMYRELFFPRHRLLCKRAKELSGAHIFLHCCGGIYPLIPDLIDAGVEILNPVQTSARDMDAARLKREFGKDVTFWGGGSDTQRILPYGTPAEVRDDVRRRIEIFAPGGGFVWTPIHNIMSDVPPDNILAALEAAYEYGKY